MKPYVYSLIILINLVISCLYGYKLFRYQNRILINNPIKLYSTITNNAITSPVRFSGSSGAAIQINNIFVSIGNNDILNGVDWTILPYERWAIVGRNGEGKSTLLKAITSTGGEILSIREGTIEINKKARLGYLEQKGVSGSTKTVREEVSSRMERLVLATKNLERLEQLVSEGRVDDEVLTQLSEAQGEFEAAGGYNVEQKISLVLKGLGFVENDYDKLCSEFSGGWQMRIALARLLLSEPDLLLLDEPTNHLDKGARDWLATYLSKYDGTLLLVSHDENLLRLAANSIAEVRSGKIELYKSRSYEQWQIEREERVKLANSLLEANQREIARLQTFVDRFGAKTMGASLAQSKLKTIEKLENQMPDSLSTQIDTRKPVLNLPTPPRGSKLLVQLFDGAIAYTPDSPPILEDINISIERGQRIAVRGPNGAGKSTLFSALSGELQLVNGQRILGDGLELGYFKQDLAQVLDPSLSAVEVVVNNVRQIDPTISDEKARNVLGSLGLVKEKATRLVGHLSGGEKARVALASFVLIPHNLLLLDEPSNHLDTVTIETLTNALTKFAGTSIVISHDRQFLSSYQPTHVLTVRNGRVTLEERELNENDWNDDLFDRYTDSKVVNKIDSKIIIKTDSKTDNKIDIKTSHKANKKKNKETGNKIDSKVVIQSTNQLDNKSDSSNYRRITKIESSLKKYELEVESIDQQLITNGTNSQICLQLYKDKEKLIDKINKLYEEMESLM